MPGRFWICHGRPEGVGGGLSQLSTTRESILEVQLQCVSCGGKVGRRRGRSRKTRCERERERQNT